METDPPGITDKWLNHIAAELPHYEVNDSPSGLGTPMSRNWFYRAFGAPALIYEVGDQTDRGLIKEVASTAARWLPVATETQPKTSRPRIEPTLLQSR